MNTGICVKLRKESNISEDIRIAAENGFESCQIVSWDQSLRTETTADAILKALKRTGIEISALWCGWDGPKLWDPVHGPGTSGLVPEQWREIRIGNLCQGSDFAKMIGVRDVVSHMGFIPESASDPLYPGFVSAAKKVAEYLKNNGQRLLFESGQETPETLCRAITDIAADNLGVNLDTGNLILYGKADPVAALDLIGKFVCNVHAKDGFYPEESRKLGKETEIGSGKVDFKAFLKKLIQIGYDGPITIERELGEKDMTNRIRRSAEYIRGIISEITH